MRKLSVVLALCAGCANFDGTYPCTFRVAGQCSDGSTTERFGNATIRVDHYESGRLDLDGFGAVLEGCSTFSGTAAGASATLDSKQCATAPDPNGTVRFALLENSKATLRDGSRLVLGLNVFFEARGTNGQQVGTCNFTVDGSGDRTER